MARNAARRFDGPIEGPWALPEGWRWERLGSFLSQTNESIAPDRAPNTQFQLFSVPSHSTRRPEIVFGKDVGSAKQRVQPGDVLLCKINPRINRVWKVSDYTGQPLIASTEWIRFSASAAIASDYLRYFLQRDEVRDHLAMNVSGVGGSLMRVRSATVAPICFPVPNFDDQVTIAARIDELFAEIEEGEGALRRARGDLQTWRKALLKAAVTGELTADWRAASKPKETGADLLARILADRRARWLADPRNKGKRYVEPPGPDTADLPTLPDGWVWASVAQLGDVVTGATPPTSDARNYGGDVPFFTPGDLDAGIRLTSTKRAISSAGLATVRSIPAESVLVVCIGATIGKVGYNAMAGATNQQINTIVPHINELGKYIFSYFDGLGRDLVVDRASSTTLPILSKADFCRVPMPLPSLEEVGQINCVVHEQQEIAEDGDFLLKDSHNTVATLRQSILSAAFRGQLA